LAGYAYILNDYILGEIGIGTREQLGNESRVRMLIDFAAMPNA